MKKSYNLPLTEKIKAEQKVKQEEERKQLETEIRTLEDEIQYGKLNIAETLEKYVRKMEANADRYQNIAEDLQVAYSMRPHFKNLENMEAIKRKLQEDRKTRKQEEKQEEKDSTIELQQTYQELLNQKQRVIAIKQMMKSLPEYIDLHDQESFQQIKANLNTKIQGMITKARVEHLQAQKQQISQEKESIFQKLFYRTTLKEQKIANIEAKIELEKRQASTRNPENRVSLMMTDLYDCCAQDLNGEFSPEMTEVIYAIRRNFKNLPNEEKLVQQAYQTANSNYPAIIGEKRIFKRKQIEYYRQDTDRIRTEIYNTIYHKEDKPIRQEVQISALSNFEETINSIRRLLERDEEQDNTKNRDTDKSIA